MRNDLKIGFLPLRAGDKERKGGWYVSTSDDLYMRDDGTFHTHMNGNGGTYFALKEEAEKAIQALIVPKTWGEMTAAEKGALLLAHHEGKVIEFYSFVLFKDWATPLRRHGPAWSDDTAYRVRPPEPVRGKVTIAVNKEGDFSQAWVDDDAQRITLPVVNCEVPTGTYTNEDGERIVVERVNG